jgi:regulator of sigma E protease
MIETLQTILTYGGSFVLVLGLVVFVHEYGHFIAGRSCGIAVRSFSFGWGPEWFGWTDKEGTRWKVSRFPIGGFVSWADDADPTSTRADPALALPPEEARRRGHYHAMPIWARSIATAGGPLANFIFAIVAFALLLLITGRDVARIDQVTAASPAAAAGLQVGDIVRAVDGHAVGSFQDLQARIAPRPGETVRLTIERSRETLHVEAVVGVRSVGEGDRARQVGVLGIAHTSQLYDGERVGPPEAIVFGAQQSWAIIAGTVTYIGDIFSGRQAADQLAGPLGIMQVSGQVASGALSGGAEHSMGDKVLLLALSLLNLTAVLSVAVGIANLLPIPLLDGGNLVLYGIEALRGGKRLPLAAQQWVIHAGFAAVGALFLFATWNDIQRFLG